MGGAPVAAGGGEVGSGGAAQVRARQADGSEPGRSAGRRAAERGRGGVIGPARGSSKAPMDAVHGEVCLVLLV